MFNKKWGGNRVLAIVMSLLMASPVLATVDSSVSYAAETNTTEAVNLQSESLTDSSKDSTEGSDQGNDTAGTASDADASADDNSNSSTSSSSDSGTSNASSDASSKDAGASTSASASSASTEVSSDAASSASTKEQAEKKDSPVADQGEDGYANFTSDTKIADFVFGSKGNLGSADTYSKENGYGFSDVDFNTDPVGWSSNVYHPRSANVVSGSASNVSDGDDYLKIGSKVWTETESTGYGVYTYENTSTLDVDLYNADYKVEVTLTNPTDSSYTAYLEAEDITQASDITLAAGATSTTSYEVNLIDGQLNLKFLQNSSAKAITDAADSSVYVKEVKITRLATQEAGSKPTIYIASDSTVQTYDTYYYPQTGWGQTLSQWFGDAVEEREADNCTYSQSQVYETKNAIIENRAIGGRSSKSFVEEGKLEDLLEDIDEGDYLLIQWGHNDATYSRPNRYVSSAEFSKWIMDYVNGAYERGATPVLVTPVSRYSYTTAADGTVTWASNFEAYRQVMISLAKEYDIPIIDLTARSGDICESFGVEGSKSLFLQIAAGEYTTGAYVSGVSDSTHLQWYGAYKFSQAVAQGIVDYADNKDNDYKLVDTCNDQLDGLAKLVVNNAAADAPEKVTGLDTTSVGATSVALTWDKGTGAELYYIYRAELDADTKLSDVDFTKAEKYSVSTKASYTDANCKAGVTYAYAVAGYNSYGKGEICDPISVTTKSAGYKFDFNYQNSATMEGWTGVNEDQLYDAAKGYGWITAPKNGRSRVGNGKAYSSDMADDFNMGDGEFAVDVPNGTYEVTVYAADLMEGSSTIKPSYKAEGSSLGSIACKQSLGSCTGTVEVTDGQLNVVLDGTNKYINGMTITSLLAAPSNLTITELSFADTTASFLLSFNTVEEAKSYTVYEKKSTDAKYSVAKTYTAQELIDSELDCRAMTAELGETYSYYMTCTTADGTESAQSNIVTKQMLDANVAVPSAVANVVCTSPEEDSNEMQNSISISWDASASSEKVIKYIIYRSEKAENAKGFKSFEKIGESKTASYTDKDDVATNIHYYYKVAAMNAGGVGELSKVCITPIAGKLSQGGRENYASRDLVAIDLAGSKGAETKISATDSDGNAITKGVYLSWRSYPGDFNSSNELTTTFTVYRNGSAIASNVSVTNCVDEGGSASDTYTVTGSNDGNLGLSSVDTKVWADQYIELSLNKPADETMPDGSTCTYTANDMSVGDLDGDGELELLVKWYPSNAKDNSGSGYTGTTYLDAYNVDFGNGDADLLWRIDFGINIRSGAHYTQFQVWDYDGDGVAEVAAKTADGTTTYDGSLSETGYVGECSMASLSTASVSEKNDYRNTSGYVLSGPEYFTMFNGEDGTIIDSVNYTPERGTVSSWGDAYGNRVDRFLAGTAYLNGTTPFAVFCRGYYTRTCVTAYYLSKNDDGTESIGTYWTFDSKEDGSEYEGQGNHQLSINDVDEDGKDEIIYGSLTLDNDGSVLYCTGLGHGDALHVSDWIPTNPGLEIMAVHEHNNASYHVEIHDAETGKVLTGYYVGKDTGRGVAGDIDPTALGAEFWSIANPSYSGNDEPTWDSRDASVFSGLSGIYDSSDPDGSEMKALSYDSTPAVNFTLYWDGDLLSEQQDHTFNSEGYYPLTTTIEKWDYENSTTYNLFSSSEVLTSNGTKGNLGLVADILGDWRDEIVARCASDNSKVRIYSTTISTDYVIPCSLTDLAYREGVAWQNTGYNQPAHTSYLISEGLVTAQLSEGDMTSSSAEVQFTAASDGTAYGHDVEGYDIYRADVTTDANGKQTIGDYEKIDEVDGKDLKKAGSSNSSAEEEEEDPVDLKFDFGAGNTADGWTQVLADASYDEKTGYGFTDTSSNSNKTYTAWNDDANADLYNDSVLGWKANGSAEFDVDLPNGTYDVTYYIANGSGAVYDKVTAEGTEFTDVRRGNTSISASSETVQVTVKDGQMNIVNTVSKTGYAALYFTAIEIKDVNYDTWAAEKASASEKAAEESTETRYSYVDRTVKSNMTYSYKIAAVVDGKSSYNSAALTVSTAVAIAKVNDTDVSFDVPNTLTFADEDALSDYLLTKKAAFSVTDAEGNTVNASVKNYTVTAVDMKTNGSYTAYANIKGYSSPVEVTVKVVDNKPTGFAALSDVEVIKGAAAVLPSTVSATYLDGTTSNADVTWDTAKLDTNTVGKYTVQGSVSGSDAGSFVTITVNVVEDYIVSAADIYLDADIYAKEENVLPKTAAVTFKSGAAGEAAVTWDTSSLKMDTIGTYAVSGKVEGFATAVSLHLNVCYPALQRFDFGISSTASDDSWTTLTVNPKGSTKTFDALGVTYSAAKGYGFLNGSATNQGRSESYTCTTGTIPQNVYTDFIIPDGQTFAVDVANGTYTVDIIGGSAYKSTVKCSVEGTAYSVANTAGSYTIKSVEAVVSDGQLTITFDTGATSRLDGIVVRTHDVKAPVIYSLTNKWGTDYCYDSNGNLVKNMIVTIDGTNYYAGSKGTIVKNDFISFSKKKGSSDTYYFDGKGQMVKGFLVKWTRKYYFDQNGVMQTGLFTAEEDGVSCSFYADANGMIKKDSFVSVTNTDGTTMTCYFNSDGHMVKGEMEKWWSHYYFGKDGAMAVNSFVSINGKTYYFGSNGKRVSSWQTINGQKYYFGSDGVMATGVIKIWGKTYTFDENGIFQA